MNFLNRLSIAQTNHWKVALDMFPSCQVLSLPIGIALFRVVHWSNTSMVIIHSPTVWGQRVSME